MHSLLPFGRLLALLVAGSLTVACSAESRTAAAPTKTAPAPLTVFGPAGPGADMDGSVELAHWHGTGATDLRFTITSGTSRLMLRISCGNGSFAFSNARNETIFGGDCNPATAAAMTALTPIVGESVHLQVRAGTSWVAGVWAFRN